MIFLIIYILCELLNARQLNQSQCRIYHEATRRDYKMVNCVPQNVEDYDNVFVSGCSITPSPVQRKPTECDYNSATFNIRSSPTDRVSISDLDLGVFSKKRKMYQIMCSDFHHRKKGMFAGEKVNLRMLIYVQQL